MDLTKIIPAPEAFRPSFLLIAAVFLAVLGCKPKDTTPPNLQITAPSDNFSGIATHEVLISGTATDEGGLNQIHIYLTNEIGQIESSETYDLEGKSADFDIRYTLGNRYTETGNFQLRVQVTDLEGNSDSRFLDASIQELPLEQYGVFLGIEGASADYSLGFLDSLGNLSSGQILSDSLVDMEVDHRNSILLTGTLTPGRLTGYQADDMSLLFSENLGAGTFPAFRDLNVWGGEYYVCGELQPYLKLFGPGGELLTSYSTITQPARRVLGTSQHIYVWVETPTGSVKKLDAYQVSTRSLSGFYNTNMEVMELFSLESEDICLFGNVNGTAKSVVLTPGNLAVQSEESLQEPLIQVAGGPDRAWVLTPSGVYSWDGASGQFGSRILSGTFSSISYDAADNRLILGKSNGIEIRSASGSLVSDYSGQVNGTVRFIRPWYNK